jgi:hypothetical protein
MRLRALTLAIAAAGVLASLGSAAAPQKPGKPTHCARFDVQGTLKSIGSASFSLRRSDGTTLTIALTPKTDAFWTGTGTLAGPVAGERVWAKGTLCGGEYSATWVLVRPKQAK